VILTVCLAREIRTKPLILIGWLTRATGRDGYGNGTGGAKGIRGTVASTGFGNGVAYPPAGAGESTEQCKAAPSRMPRWRHTPKKESGRQRFADDDGDILDKPRRIHAGSVLDSR